MKSKSDKKILFSWVAFLCLLAVNLLIAALYLYNIIQWRNYPDFGCGFITATGIDTVAVVTEHGSEAGIQVGDRILKINGQPFSTITERRAALNWRPGAENVYVIERNGRQSDIIIKNIPIGIMQVIDKTGYLYILGLCYLFIGIIVFLMKKHERVSWIFFLATSTLGLYMTFLYKVGRMTPSWLETVHIFVTTFTPAVFIHLGLGFPEERSILRKYPLVQFSPYVISAGLFLGTRMTVDNVADAPRIFHPLFALYMGGSLLFFLGSCLQLVLKSSSELAQVRSKLILIGASIAALVPLLDLLCTTFLQKRILPSFNFNVPFFAFFPLSLAYSIVRFNLFEFDAIIKRTYGYLLTTGAVAGVYGIFVLLSNIAFGHLEVTKSQAFPLIFVLLVVFFFNPIRNRVQQFIDRTFYRLEYDYQETVQRISETMCSLQNLPQVTRVMMDTALGAMFIDSGSLMILDRGRGAYDRRIHVAKEDPLAAYPGNGASARSPSTGDEERDPAAGTWKGQAGGLSLPADLPFLKRVAEKRKIVSRYDLEEDPFFEGEREAGRQVFDQLESTLVVPIVYENELKGLMGLGDKKSGKFYRIEDIKLLNTLANQGAVAIENAMLLDEVIEKERMEEELSIARDLQMSMLPAACPRLTGFDVTALCVPAREVGGDFYDFIDMGAESAGLIVGDVTGKGVSGALVMAASRSVFRMLSDERLDVGSIMTQANRRAKKDIREGMFVAVLYAVLDGPRRALRLCSAGQTQPVLFSSRDGTARLVETAGDSLPIGIVDEVSYEETVLPVERGDKLVFYTDGIVEAVNEQGEMFGFDRLLEVVRQSGDGEAEAVLGAVKSKVDAFVGRAPQHDDITLIVAGVKR